MRVVIEFDLDQIPHDRQVQIRRKASSMLCELPIDRNEAKMFLAVLCGLESYSQGGMAAFSDLLATQNIRPVADLAKHRDGSAVLSLVPKPPGT